MSTDDETLFLLLVDEACEWLWYSLFAGNNDRH